MLFNSLAFAIFLPIVFLLYWAIPDKYRYLILFVASYYFYMSWNVKYVFLILFTTAISYGCALALEKAEEKQKKKILLFSTLVASLGCLFFFKYFNFASESLCGILNLFAIEVHPITLHLLLPVGISFYTFQTLSYVIDVYRKDVVPEHNFIKYATFISFFPQLVAGPIERTKNLMPQITGKHRFSYDKASYGLKQMAWGYFKKMVIADTLAIYVDTVYDNLSLYQGFPLVVVSVMFSIQIYCDFSGYSDIAIGCAKLFGIDLMKNFDSPYFATSIKEFWSRWHISLSTWFKDYVYIPLGGNRVSRARNCWNLLVTFMVSGLWHGANWTYVIWGGLHGLLQVVEKLLCSISTKNGKRKIKDEKKGWLFFGKVLLVFGFTTFAWIFFRAETFQDAIYVLSHMFDGIRQPAVYFSFSSLYTGLGLNLVTLLGMVCSLVMLMLFDYASLKKDVLKSVGQQKIVVRWVIYIAFVIFLTFNVPITSGQEFIYFQF